MQLGPLLPRGHAEQELALTLPSVHWPVRHRKQEVLPTSLEWKPELQERQLCDPLWLVCCPALHKLHPTALRLRWEYPRGHNRQVPLAWSDSPRYLPSSHMLQLLLPGLEVARPTMQGKQNICPWCSW
jgi:hypothetical protein